VEAGPEKTKEKGPRGKEKRGTGVDRKDWVGFSIRGGGSNGDKEKPRKDGK